MIMNVRFSKSADSRLLIAGPAAIAVLLLAGALIPLAAQTEAAQKPKKDDAKAAAPAAQAPAEGFKWGQYEGHSEVEIGYRTVSDIDGNKDMYRSMINLGEGPKLLRSSLSLRSNYGSGRLFDRLDLSINNWGGDPYNNFRLNIGRTDIYEFRVDYRNLNYFNYVSTWANPLLASGNTLGQHSLNVTYRTTDLELKLRPGRKVRPYVAYSRATGFGPSFTTYGVTGNDFLLSSNWNYAADDYRGGVEISLPKLALTFEQGYRRLKNDTGAENTTPGGNVSRPYIGQTITLGSLDRSYHDRTTMPVTKLLAKFTPIDQLKFTGRYIYSMADVAGVLGEVRAGSLVSLEDRLIYRAAVDSFSTRARQPNHNGGFVVEFAPFSRLSFVDQFDTRSYHVSGSAALASSYLNARPLSGEPQTRYDTKTNDILDSYLSYDLVRNSVEAELDIGSGFVIRGGQRYANVETKLVDSDEGGTDSGYADVTHQTGIFGLAFRPSRRVHMALDYERNHADGMLTRTDLLNYRQFRFEWRVDPIKNLSLSGRIGMQFNKNRADDIKLKSHNRNYSFAVNYERSERITVNLDYTRSNILSDLAILLPQTLDLDNSYYDERGSSLGGSMGIGIYRGWRADLGYRVILSAGSFPLNYYQPFVSMTIPLQRHWAFKTHWQHFSYNEKGSNLLDHRSHLVTYSLAFSY